MNITIDRILAELGLATVQIKVLQEENAALQAKLTPKVEPPVEAPARTLPLQADR